MPKVLFVADKLSEETRSAREVHPGGAELTDASAIAACPWPLERRRFRELDPAALSGFDLIVVGNSQQASRQQLDSIAATRRHVLFEHDLRICVYNGNFPSAGDVLHKSFQRCWCPHLRLRELMQTARGVLFLTERQRAVYRNNPFFTSTRHAILGCSLFSEAFFERAERFVREGHTEKRGACVVYSPNAIKGYAPSRRWALEHSESLVEIRDAAPEQVLEKFSGCGSFVYLPVGLEPAGRLPVEARLFGCDVVVNPNVGVAGESWWRGSRSDALSWLSRAPHRFWQLAEEFLSHEPVETAPRPSALAPGLEALARASRLTRVLVRPLPPAPGVARRARTIERFTRW